jgi:hypothetical protein
MRAKSETDLLKAISALGVPLTFSPPDTDVPAVEFFDCPNLFATAVYVAFFDHYPLKINPNVVWLTILQGFATYVSGNSECLRHKFVVHEGKQTITIVREDFRDGSNTNDWPSVFPQFAHKIEERTNASVRNLAECNFSNTTPVDKACSHITLMSICQDYFEYRVRGGCGIPWIELLGTANDWKTLREKAGQLREFEVPPPPPSPRPRWPPGPEKGLEFYKEWLDCLLPALDHFVRAAEGAPDIAFWGSVCNMAGGSGSAGDPINGWINVFFPYLRPEFQNRLNCGIQWQRNYEFAKMNGLKNAVQLVESGGGKESWQATAPIGGVRIKDIPSGMVKAPVRVNWIDAGRETVLDFCAGIFALHQHPDGALEPRTGWAVVEN